MSQELVARPAERVASDGRVAACAQVNPCQERRLTHRSCTLLAPTCTFHPGGYRGACALWRGQTVAPRALGIHIQKPSSSSHKLCPGGGSYHRHQSISRAPAPRPAAGLVGARREATAPQAREIQAVDGRAIRDPKRKTRQAPLRAPQASASFSTRHGRGAQRLKGSQPRALTRHAHLGPGLLIDDLHLRAGDGLPHRPAQVVPREAIADHRRSLRQAVPNQDPERERGGVEHHQGGKRDEPKRPWASPIAVIRGRRRAYPGGGTDGARRGDRQRLRGSLHSTRHSNPRDTVRLAHWIASHSRAEREPRTSPSRSRMARDGGGGGAGAAAARATRSGLDGKPREGDWCRHEVPQRRVECGTQVRSCVRVSEWRAT